MIFDMNISPYSVKGREERDVSHSGDQITLNKLALDQLYSMSMSLHLICLLDEFCLPGNYFSNLVTERKDYLHTVHLVIKYLVSYLLQCM